MRKSNLMLALSACTVVTFAAGIALAHDAKAVPAKAATALSDMKVARDKETGKLRVPTDEENAQLKSQGSFVAPSVVVIQRPFTTVETRRDGSAVAKRSLDDLDNLYVTRTPEGKTVLRHSDKPARTAPTTDLPRE